MNLSFSADQIAQDLNNGNKFCFLPSPRSHSNSLFIKYVQVDCSVDYLSLRFPLMFTHDICKTKLKPTLDKSSVPIWSHIPYPMYPSLLTDDAISLKCSASPAYLVTILWRQAEQQPSSHAAPTTAELIAQRIQSRRTNSTWNLGARAPHPFRDAVSSETGQNLRTRRLPSPPARRLRPRTRGSRRRRPDRC